MSSGQNRHLLGDQSTQILQKSDDTITVSEPKIANKIEIKDIGDVVKYHDDLKEAKVSVKKRKKKVINVLEKLWSGYREKSF